MGLSELLSDTLVLLFWFSVIILVLIGALYLIWPRHYDKSDQSSAEDTHLAEVVNGPSKPTFQDEVVGIVHTVRSGTTTIARKRAIAAYNAKNSIKSDT